MRLPPHNQRRLTAYIRDRYGDQYADCLAYFHDLQERGLTYEQIAVEANKLGQEIRPQVCISQFTVRNWLQKHDRDCSCGCATA